MGQLAEADAFFQLTARPCMDQDGLFTGAKGSSIPVDEFSTLNG